MKKHENDAPPLTDAEPPLIQEWQDAIGAAAEWPVGALISRWVSRVTAAGTALAKDYAAAVRNLRAESAGRVRVHSALAKAIGGDAASKINDDSPPLTDAERRRLAQVPPQPSTVPHVVRLLVTFDGAASRVVVSRLPSEWPYSTINCNAVALGGEVLASGRSWGDVEQALEAACIDSQGRTP
jgi:hypothetical protein